MGRAAHYAEGRGRATRAASACRARAASRFRWRVEVLTWYRPTMNRMNRRGRRGRGGLQKQFVVVLCALRVLCGDSVVAQTPTQTPPAPASQNPSPMVENTRAHERLAQKGLGGTKRTFTGPSAKPVEVWIPDKALKRDAVPLVIHFLGAAWLPEQAVADLNDGT